jgi:hypothetical protein
MPMLASLLFLRNDYTTILLYEFSKGSTSTNKMFVLVVPAGNLEALVLSLQ